jgi:hypothetical protein
VSTSLTPHPQQVDQPADVVPRTTLVAMGVSGVVLLLNAGLLGSRLLFDSRPFSAAAVEGTHLLFWTIQLAALVALAQVYPRLGRLVRGGRRLPELALTLAGVGVVLDAATRFLEAFAVPVLAERYPEFVDNTPPAMLLVPLLGAGVVHMVGLLALAWAAFARGIFPRPAAVLIGVGGVAVPAIGPLAGVLLGAGLAWAARSALRS